MIFKQLIQIFFFVFFILNSNILKGIENKIIAMVNNEPITSYELKNKILTKLILSDQIVNQEIIDQSKIAAIKSLINVKLKKFEIEKYKIKPDLNNINSHLNKISSNNIEALKKKFTDNSIDYQIFLNEIKVELAWQQLIYSKYNKKVKIDEKLVNNELQELIKNGKKQNEYKLSEIEIEITEENKDIAVNEVMKQIDSIGFEKTARKLSISPTAMDNGNLGWVNSESLSKQMSDILNQMKINEISKPIIKLNNVLFFKITDKRSFKANNLNIDELKKNLINNKTNELFKLYSNNHLSKIRNNAFIKFR
ncbi:peptidylprolyl isomerase [Pelagibacteraceae bacterium]|jgi:peptidyl-prolyl cis-trans isomerase SurA|nr:peptidylprolyl isomerase [Pelagibacteraceae bacterium]